MSLFKEEQVDGNIAESNALISRVLVEHSPAAWVPLLSGGHDSICACHLASMHPDAPDPFPVYHIDTGICSNYTRGYVQDRCDQFGWKLNIVKSPRECDTYEAFVRAKGMPGPGMHSRVYQRIKERSIQHLAKTLSKGQRPVMFLSGSRRQESQRRMGYAVAVRRGDGLYKETGHLRNPSRLWVAPCLEWVPCDQKHHMDEWDIPRNRVKDMLGLSGECFCGAMAGEDSKSKQSERELIKLHCPDVDREITRLEEIARELGLPDKWGHKPPKPEPETAQEESLFMDLCVGCQKKGE